MATVRFQTPYNDCHWKTQWFSSLSQAERMVAFYRSCGSPAHIIPIEDDDVLIIG